MKDEFQHRAWVCISEEFDILQATKAILQALDCPTKQSDDLNLYQLEVKEQLKDKKFFLVLDDVWNQNRTIWEVFQTPFNYGAPGSKILITTRHKKVAEIMHSSYIHLLKPLQVEDCWKLFTKHAFNDQYHHVDANIVSIGRAIVNRCGGLPLAIKTLGSLLYTRLSHQDWVMILESDIWQLPEDDSNIIPSLRLSYHYLPLILKCCFAFCSIFPKDYMIEKDVLIQFWMAEGLLYSSQTSKSLEEVGYEIFNDLESRSFFEASKYSGDYFIMHDLLNDLAKSVIGEFCVQLEVDQAQDIPTKARYFSYLGNINEDLKISEDVFMCHQLRSFILWSKNFPNCDKIDDVVSRLAYLKYKRVLSLSRNKNFRKMTNDISKLKHLHYLDLSYTPVKKLPNSMCLLINLQTLKLNGCDGLIKLPSHFHKLINLHHLDLEGSGIKKMPKHLGRLQHLQIMNRFVVGRNGGSDLKELEALHHLRGTLTISNMDNIDDPTSLEEANLKEKHLDKLNLKWRLLIEYHEDAQHQEQVLEALELNCYVKELIIEGSGGTRLSNWFDGSHLSSLTLSSCINCVNLPPLGQLPFLQKLKIQELHGIKVIGQEFYGNGSSIAPFRSLSCLIFSIMKEWEEWNMCYEGHSFPCLRVLHICACLKLTKSLPQQHLPSLKRLSISHCPKLIASSKDWGLHEILSLEQLQVGDIFGGVESFPEEGLLPPNLQSLEFNQCSNLKTINHRGLLHLHSLTSLSFSNCTKMSFEFLPEDSLPTSLNHLNIGGYSPLLKERCEKGTGPDWPKIAHIPDVYIW